ncbi:MAG: hypothetical protein ACE5H0_06575 [Bacteroidota bacterium]
MRISGASVFGVLFLAFFAIGCQDTSPVGPTSGLSDYGETVSTTASSTSPASSGSLAKGGAVQSVKGSSKSVTEAGVFRKFTFHARKYADGTVNGNWKLNLRDPGDHSKDKFHGKITCFTIIGNEAWIGGFESGVGPLNEVAWRVVDNGEGKNAAPDRMSDQYFGQPAGFAAKYCDTAPDTVPPGPPLKDIDAGNIKIRP